MAAAKKTQDFEEIYNPIAKLTRPKDEQGLVRAVLDGILQGRDTAHHALLTVPVQAFASWQAKDVWEAMGSLYEASQVPDLPGIERTLLNNRKVESEEGWTNHLMWLESGTSIGDECALADSVLDLFQRRELWKLYRGQLDRIADTLDDHYAVAQETVHKSLAIVSNDQDEPEPSGDAICTLIENGLKFREDQTGAGKLAYFGIPILDGEPSEGGIPCAPGHVVIVASRAGIGKSALATQIAASSAHHGVKVFVASLELNKYEFWARLAAWETETGRGKFWAGTYNELQIAQLRSRKPILNLVSVWGPPRPHWSRLEAKIRGAALYGHKVVIVDHFSEINLSKMGAGKFGKKFENAAECAQRIKALAKELNICIVLLAQLNRDIPRGEMPGMENLRETGELEQVAYAIVALHRDEAKPASSSDRGPDAPPPVDPPLKLIVLKNRDGKAFYTRKLSMNGATCRIDDLDPYV